MMIRRAGLGALATTAVFALVGCDATLSDPLGDSGAGGRTSSAGPGIRFAANVSRGATGVPVDTIVTMRSTGGRLESVVLRPATGTPVTGRLTAGGSRWTASRRLQPGTTYTMVARAHGEQGSASSRQRFTTRQLSLDQQTYPSVAPLRGQTVGVGMPVIVTFDVPVRNRELFEKHMHVSASSGQQGSWYWLSDQEAHWRPKTYWHAGTDVTVDVDVDSLPAGNGIYGQEDRRIHFHIGDAHVYKVDTRTDHMKVFSNGRLLRTLPVTTGKPGFDTRSGVKVIVQKYPRTHMRSETIGISDQSSANYYDLAGVRWAMRLTYSGEFIHAAPWSVGDQGHSNVSHGCTGMSTADASWLYDMSRVGDVVEYTGSNRQMEFGNGYGDWNVSFPAYERGSALS